MKTVLCLFGNTALWVCVKKNVVVDSFEEPMVFDSQTDYKPCRWMSGQSVVVHLLVDNELTEIDAYPLLNSGSRWSYKSNKKALQRRLVARFPDAVVRTAKRKANLGAALVQHINLSDSVRGWLSHIEGCGIVFCSISTVAEVVADQWGASTQSKNTIVVSAGSEFVRHTYCQSGYALFTRAVSHENSKEFVEQFLQTLGHLSSSALIENPVPVHAIGLDDHSVAALRALELVSEVIVVQRKNVPITEGDSVNSRYATEYLLTLQLLANAAVRKNHVDRQVSVGLDRHMQVRRKKIHFRQNMLVISLFLISLGYTGFNELQRLNQHDSFQLQKNELTNAIDGYKETAQSLSSKSGLLSMALLDSSALEAGSGISPAILLTILAEGFTQYQEIELQKLSWVVRDNAIRADESYFESGAAAAPTAREVLPMPGALPSATQVKVTGFVAPEESLREQHNVLNGLTALLESQKELSNLSVLQAPLKQFDGAVFYDNDDLRGRSTFELQFELNRSVDNDV